MTDNPPAVGMVTGRRLELYYNLTLSFLLFLSCCLSLMYFLSLVCARSLSPLPLSLVRGRKPSLSRVWSLFLSLSFAGVISLSLSPSPLKKKGTYFCSWRHSYYEYTSLLQCFRRHLYEIWVTNKVQLVTLQGK